ncbi:MAG: ABC transporter substrate-binding protein [SAR324 cluster bacterium]
MHRVIQRRPAGLLSRVPRALRRMGVAAAGTALLGGLVGLEAPAALGTGRAAHASEPDGTLRFGLGQEPDSLDPTFSRTYAGRLVLTQLCERLYDVDGNGNPTPQLAADLPESSRDGRVQVIRLRSDLRFNDGTPFDAAAVKASLDRYVNQPGSMRSAELAAVAGVDAIDAHTIRVRLDRPYAPLLSVLSDRAGMILSPAQMSRLGDRFETEPVCVGPWAFVKRLPGKKIVLERSSFYSGAAGTGVRRIVFKSIPDSARRLAALRDGEVDVINAVPARDIAGLRADARFGVTQVLGPGYVGITFNIANRSGRSAGPANLGTPWARQPKVREAFEASLDREAINRQALGGEIVPGCTPISPVASLHPKGLKCSVRDIPAAKRLLAEAGYPGGLSLDLTLVDDPVQLRVGEAIRAMEQDAGIQVRLKPAPFADVMAQQEGGQFDALLMGFAGRLDPDSVIYPVQTCRGALNFSLSCDPALDRLLNQAQEQMNPAERQRLYSEAVEKISQNRTIIYLYHQKFTTAFSRRVSGLQAPPDGLLRLAGIRLDAALPDVGQAALPRRSRSM